MTKIKNETQYNWVMSRIEQLLTLVSNDTPKDDPNFIELELLSNLSADYADIHYSVKNLTIENGIVVEKKKKKKTPKGLRFRIHGYRKSKNLSNYVLVPRKGLSKNLVSIAK